MKVKASYKDMIDYCPLVIQVPYCELQNLLRYQTPLFYSSGRYGWNCDFYSVLGIGITTGYRLPPTAKKIPYEILVYYENEASKLDNKDDMDVLLLDFVHEVNAYFIED